MIPLVFGQNSRHKQYQGLSKPKVLCPSLSILKSRASTLPRPHLNCLQLVLDSRNLAASSQSGPNPEDTAAELLSQTTEEEGEESQEVAASQAAVRGITMDVLMQLAGIFEIGRMAFLCKNCVFHLFPTDFGKYWPKLATATCHTSRQLTNVEVLLTGAANYKNPNQSVHPVAFPFFRSALTFVNMYLIYYYRYYFYDHYLLHLLSRLGASVGVFSFYLDCLGSEIEFQTFGFLLTP